jgi:hypothetical protein
MDRCKQLMYLSVLAYKEGQFSNAAKFFTSAMESDGLESFVSFLDPVPQGAAKTMVLDESQNTLSPSLASVVDEVESAFRAEASMLEEGDEVVEASCVDVDDELDDFVIVSSSGPIKLKN